MQEDPADVSALPDLQQGFEIAFSVLQIAVLVTKYSGTPVSASCWLDGYCIIKQRGNTPNRDNGRS